MTKDIIEYSDMARVFQLHQGRLVGADLYSEKSTLYRQGSREETGKHEEVRDEMHQELRDEVRKEIRDEVRQEVREEIREDILEGVSVFDIFGFQVKGTYEKGIIVTEIRPGSVAESGGLKLGERIRKVSFKGHEVRNIYSVGGLKMILKRAIEKGKESVNILQNGNRYHIVDIPQDW
jgi:C-terminal processing protease CtpA/Prc